MKAIFISVRTGSSRLPNKSILKIKGKHTIEYVIDSVKKSKYTDKIVLCTTKKSEDDILCEIAEKHNIEYYRGSEHNKFKRWCGAAHEYNVNFFVTADGDDLFYDSQLADICFKQGDGYQFVNGQGLYNDTYGFRRSTIENIIEKLDGEIIEPHEVSTFISDIGLITLVLSDVPDILKKKEIRMTLDYQEDFDFFKTIIENLKDDFTLVDVLNYIENNKSVIDINYFREKDWVAKQRTVDVENKLQVGDWVIPKVVGIVELGDPPYEITEVEDGIYTIVQLEGNHKHTMRLPIDKLRVI